MEPWPKPAQSVLLVIGFIRFYRFYRFYVSLGDIWCCPIYFTSLLFTYSYLIIPCVFSAGCHLLYLSCSCMHVLTTRFSIHVYALDLSIHMCLSMHATWHSHHHSLRSSDSFGSSCPGLRACSVWIFPVADLRSATVAWISGRPSRAPSFQAPWSALEFSCYGSEPLFVLFVLVHLLVFSHLRLSVI